ncbi:hypothetical protein N9L97_04020 [Cyclobacteriaceae bacterium]|jgi:hypothetical protein|nr:hypothetical protein [Cyclobacteriaceae bacterium]|tara:strand:- start:219 stop:506 length:288 start_codon:yes stop_codon:yes gene_type:complete
MAVTRLERKGRKNKNVAKNRVATIQRLSFVPVIKNVDVDAIKKEFDAKKAEPAVKVEKVVKAEKVEKTVAAKAEKGVKTGKPAKAKAPKAKKSAE